MKSLPIVIQLVPTLAEENSALKMKQLQNVSKNMVKMIHQNTICTNTSLAVEHVEDRRACVLNQLLRDSCEEEEGRVCNDQKHWLVQNPAPAPGRSQGFQDAFSATRQRTHEPGHGAPRRRASLERGRACV